MTQNLLMNNCFDHQDFFVHRRLTYYQVPGTRYYEYCMYSRNNTVVLV